MSKLPKQDFSENILVGFETSDDAGVFKLTEETALVQTLDFFTPVADDPEIYGKIAAVNSLNDVYAMGGTPITALSIVCFPQSGNWDVLGKIMLGGQIALNAENVVVLGGHSVDDKEIKFGYSITGIVESKRVVTNSDARPGDVLILTKPIGTGVISTAIKFKKASKIAEEAAINLMTSSAAAASKLMLEAGANACTDITGFGLLGHGFEMAKASKVTLKIKSGEVPLLPEVLDLIEQKMLTRGDRNNRMYIGENIHIENNVTPSMQSALFDPQTAGGLLISMEREKAAVFTEKLEGARVIGEVENFTDFLIKVE